MQHFDKTIKPKNAQRLAKHVLTCEACRSLYLVMDEAVCENEAPENFTESVMEAVRGMAQPAPKKEDCRLTLRLVWGFSALIMALGLFVIQDLTRLAERLTPIADRIVNAFDFSISVDGLGFTALLLVAIMGILLYVLNNEESAKA
jgi:hypothetical protein